jgi:hypothetical protein
MAISNINIAAEDLNIKFEALGKKYDGVFSQLNSSVRTALQKVLSDWQDFYFAEENYDNWPPIDNWIKVFNDSESLLDANIQSKRLKAKKQVLAKVKESIDIEQPTVIYGRNQNSWKVLVGLLSAGIGLGGALAYIGKKIR